MATAPEQLMIP